MNINKNHVLVFKDEIKPTEVLALRKSTGWGDGDTEPGWLSNIKECIQAVGIRDKLNGELLGVGFIVGNRRHAVLCDFNVNPKYQGVGLGTRILNERMRIIDELKIPYVYTSLSDENPLSHRYKQFGFNNTGENYFRDNSDNLSAIT